MKWSAEQLHVSKYIIVLNRLTQQQQQQPGILFDS